MMVSDPWPLSEEEHSVLLRMANHEAKARCYGDWIVAYREFQKPERSVVPN